MTSPGHRKWRHHFIPDLNGLHTFTDCYDPAGKLMTHNEASSRWLVTSEGVEFPDGVRDIRKQAISKSKGVSEYARSAKSCRVNFDYNVSVVLDYIPVLVEIHFIKIY